MVRFLDLCLLSRKKDEHLCLCSPSGHSTWIFPIKQGWHASTIRQSAEELSFWAQALEHDNATIVNARLVIYGWEK